MNASNNRCPWVFTGSNATECGAPGFVFLDTGRAPSYVTIVSSTLSCLGSVLIVLTFFVLKDMRTGSQKIITLLALADLISAVGYIIGSANYLQHRGLNSTDDCGSFSQVCVGQATVTSYSSLVSFLWTVILALYFFLIIIFKRVKVAANLMICYNIVAWGGPLAVVIPLLALGKLGYSHFAASNWCYVKEHKALSNDFETIVIIFVAGKFWEILSYILVSVLYIVITVYIGRSRRQMRNTVMEPRVVHVETRLLLIPIIFILLRIWGTLQFIFSLAISDKIRSQTGCVPSSVNVVFTVLGILQAIGDGGQGWGNAILYIFLSPVIRERLIGEWCGRCIDKMDDRLNRLGDRTDQANTVQYRGESIKKNGRGLSRGSSETVPILPGNKAMGYDVRKYETTTVTDGFVTSTDISLT